MGSYQPFHDAYAELVLKALDNGQTKVIWSMDYQVKYGHFGWLLGHTMMKLMMKKVLDSNLQSLAEKVET